MEKNTNVENVDYDHLPKFVIGKVNKKRGVIDFAKTMYVEENGDIGAWSLPLFSTKEAAAEALGCEVESGRSGMLDGMAVWHLDDLHLEFAKFIASGAQNG